MATESLRNVRLIEGRHHPLLKLLRRMVRTQELLADGLALLETERLIEDVLASGGIIRKVFISSSNGSRFEGLLRRLPADAEIFDVSSKVFDTLVTTQTSPGILALASAPHWTGKELFAKQPPMVLVLAGIQDPGNLGTILRAAEAFGATGAVLTQGTVSPYNAKALRATAGALFRLPFLYHLAATEALALLRQHSARIFTTVTAGGRPLREVNFTGPVAVVLGAESQGLSEDWRTAAEAVSIPMAAEVESLNVAVAAAVVLYEIANQRANTRR
ncbi:MAG: RNA methyltransferase [Acidobacteria bacterium]|nr:RNA methyltransferase [Acidobacteriota bacterium]